MSSSVSNEKILLEDVLAASHKRFPDLTESEHFEHFVANEVLKDYDLNDHQIRAGITDGGNDGQIDGFYTFVQGVLLEEDTDLPELKDATIDVVIIQAKKVGGFSEVTLNEIRSSLEALLELDQDIRELREHYNDSLRRRVEIFRKALRGIAGFPQITFRIYYATVGQPPNEKVLRSATRLEKMLEKLYPGSKASVVFVDPRGLLRLTRTAASSEHEIKAIELMPSPEGQACVLLVALDEFVRFLSVKTKGDDGADEVVEPPRINGALFESNVRAYQGRTQVNKDIQRTLKEGGPEDFWWMNNGISILTKGFVQRGKTFTLTDPQIVNGLQTSQEVFDYWTDPDRDPQDQSQARHVLVRLIQPVEEDSRNRIIRATNNQNMIPAASLRATEEVHRDVEDYFERFGLYYDRQKNRWRNEGKPMASIVTIPGLAQAVAAVVLQRPSDARGRPTTLIAKDEDYEQIFNEEYPLHTYLESVKLMRRVDDYIKREPEALTTSERKDLRFHVATVAAALHLNHPKLNPRKMHLGMLDDVADATVSEAFDIVLELVEEERKGLEGEAADLDRIAKSPSLQQAIQTKLKEELPRKNKATQTEEE